MTGLTEARAATPDALPADPLARLAGLAANAVSPPVVDARDTMMRRVHERTYHAFRDRLQVPIAEALPAAGTPAVAATTRRLAIAGNAFLVGLRVEASALPARLASDQLASGEARAIAAFEALLGLKLRE